MHEWREYLEWTHRQFTQSHLDLINCCRAFNFVGTNSEPQSNHGRQVVHCVSVSTCMNKFRRVNNSGVRKGRGQTSWTKLQLCDVSDDEYWQCPDAPGTHDQVVTVAQLFSIFQLTTCRAVGSPYAITTRKQTCVQGRCPVKTASPVARQDDQLILGRVRVVNTIHTLPETTARVVY